MRSKVMEETMQQNRHFGRLTMLLSYNFSTRKWILPIFELVLSFFLSV
jgi:hypothetical protein